MVHYLQIATISFFILFLIASVFALYLRSNDLEGLTHDSNVEQVRTCFRNANQRSTLRLLVEDTALPLTFRDYMRITIANTPTVLECRGLARQLAVPIPEING